MVAIDIPHQPEGAGTRRRRAVGGAVALAALLCAACAPDAWRPDDPFEAFLDQIQNKCGEMRIGSRSIGSDLLQNPDPYFLDVTSRYYHRKISGQNYAEALAGSFGTTPAAPAASSGPQLTLRVSLDPALARQVKPDAVLFVFARAENGPPMPLAIQRIAASELPTTLVLDDSMGMIPAMKLSGFPKVVVGARISASGNASAQPGDLQILVSGVDTARKEPLDLIINSVVP